MKKTLFLVMIGILILSGCATRNAPQGDSSDNLNQSSISATAGLSESQQALSENATDEQPNDDHLLSQDDIERMLSQAISLTEVLVISLPRDADKGVSVLNEGTINNMILYSAKYSGTDYPYDNIYIVDDFYHFPAENVNRVAYELSGKESWTLEGGDVAYNKETHRYDTTLAFSLGGYFQPEEISARYREGDSVIIVSFGLLVPTAIDGDPALEYGGSYEVEYSILNEDGHLFLRFIEMAKA